MKNISLVRKEYFSSSEKISAQFGKKYELAQIPFQIGSIDQLSQLN